MVGKSRFEKFLFHLIGLKSTELKVQGLGLNSLELKSLGLQVSGLESPSQVKMSPNLCDTL